MHFIIADIDATHLTHDDVGKAKKCVSSDNTQKSKQHNIEREY